MPSEELALSFRGQITEKHEAGRKLDAELERIVLAKLNAARECGLLLLEAQSALGHAGFESLRKDLFDTDAVRAYMSFAKKHSDKIADIRDGLRAVAQVAAITGLLEMSPGHGHQVLHGSHFFSQASSILMRLTAIYRKFISTNPLQRWTPSSAEQFAAALLPVVRIHADVCAAIRRKK